jgi:hypothetical protein
MDDYVNRESLEFRATPVSERGGQAPPVSPAGDGNGDPSPGATVAQSEREASAFPHVSCGYRWNSATTRFVWFDESGEVAESLIQMGYVHRLDTD